MRHNKNGFGSALMQYVRKGVVCSRVPMFEVSSLDLICPKLTVDKKNGSMDCAFIDRLNLEI